VIRGVLAFVVCGLLSPEVAAFAIRGSVSSPQSRKAPAGAGPQARPDSPGQRLVVTPQTEVFLDGRTCPYDKVPGTAVVTFAEVDSDGRTLLQIHFRTSK
jgi:hypothetical protein